MPVIVESIVLSQSPDTVAISSICLLIGGQSPNCREQSMSPSGNQLEISLEFFDASGNPVTLVDWDNVTSGSGYRFDAKVRGSLALRSFYYTIYYDVCNAAGLCDARAKHFGFDGHTYQPGTWETISDNFGFSRTGGAVSLLEFVAFDGVNHLVIQLHFNVQ
jgi:hypothetical protein